ncbi:MAG: fatty acid hydroxylase [Hyphomicrobium sp.]|nr:MAG: fatty acid hydroxylase [Hyphomicrobium sp.]
MNEIWSSLGEGGVRLAVFVSVFVLLAFLELARPRRVLSASKRQRWVTNWAIVIIDSALVRAMAHLVVPIAAVAAAVAAQQSGFGLLNLVALPVGLEILLAVVVLDLAIWAQHVASHKVPVLWRLHQMHHADRDIDLSTAIRFHPVEIALSMVWKILCVVALGASPFAVVLFEIILNAGAMFSHANIRLPLWLDRALRAVIVTPDMHRVHHSIERHEHDSNYGFNLSVWDRLFGTYTDQPAKGHDAMTIGLKAYQSDGPSQLGWSLALPWRGKGHDSGAQKP